MSTTEEIEGPPPPDPGPGEIVISMPESSNYVLTWTSASGASYEVKTTTNLVNGAWVPAITNIAGNGGAVSVTGAVSGAQRFYRVFLEE